MSSRIPPLLEPYLALPPEASLILLTSVLGAGSNWLVLRYLYSYLRGPGSAADEAKGGTGVVLVSFLRDGAFWRDGAARLVRSPPFSSHVDTLLRQERWHLLIEDGTGS